MTSAIESRTEARDRLRASLALEQYMPHYVVTLLVISSSTAHTAQLPHVVVEKARLTGKTKEWYFVSVFSNTSFTTVDYGIISHDALVHLNVNEKRPTWHVPLIYCVSLTTMQRPRLFDTYFVKPTFNVPCARREMAFELRLKLYRWLASSTDFCERNPLTPDERRYCLGVDSELAWDNIVYHAIAYALLRHETPFYEAWIRHETRLLAMKFCMRPDWFNGIMRVGTLTDAIARIPSFHQARLISIQSTPPVPKFAETGKLSELADKLLQGMMLLETQQFHDTEHAADIKQADKDDAAMQRDFEPQRCVRASQMPFADVLDCAPACLRSCAERVFGTTVQRAATPYMDRLTQVNYMLEHGYSAERINMRMRPHTLIEYEDSQPLQSWSDIKNMTLQAEADHERKMEAMDDAIKANVVPDATGQNCELMMTRGLCRHLGKMHDYDSLARLTETAAQHQHRVGQVNLQIRIAAKQRCHEELRDTHERRLNLGTSGGKRQQKNGGSWSDGPFVHAQMAYRGSMAHPQAIAALNSKRQKVRDDRQAASIASKLAAQAVRDQAKEAAAERARNAEIELQKEEERQREQERAEAAARKLERRKGRTEHYETLGITRNTATVDTIKAAYRQLALKLHPDRNMHLPIAEQLRCQEEFKKVLNAYESLL